jgi:hypothetical protein
MNHIYMLVSDMMKKWPDQPAEGLQRAVTDFIRKSFFPSPLPTTIITPMGG